ncbi:Fungal specific transcription factor domain-containing protein [Cladophialophora immunda]|nr:Fungal specific transcription factor domain-containing protein [Cladophialophora immunda]
MSQHACDSKQEHQPAANKDPVWDFICLDLDAGAATPSPSTMDAFNLYESQQLLAEQPSPAAKSLLSTFGEVENMLLSSIGMDVVEESLGLLEQQSMLPTHQKSPQEWVLRPDFGSASKMEDVRQIDSPYLSLELQDTLVQLFMTSVYILCPAMNAGEFYRWYQTRHHVPNDGSLKALVLQAILFVTFPHLSDQEMQGSGLGTVPQAQRILFEHTLSLYQTATLTKEGHVALIQTALLLSHWSPYNKSREVNSFWIDEAFRHAILGRLYNSTDCHDVRTWWCCVVRNRVLALALCRPNKLRRIEPGKLPEFWACERNPALTRSKYHPGKDVDQIFVALCKLSKIMSEILALQSSVGRLDSASSPQKRQKMDQEHLRQVTDLEFRLQAWAEDYETTLSTIDHDSLSRLSKVQLLIPRIIYTSTTASLYEFLIRSSHISRPISRLLHKYALNSLKEVSKAVSIQAGELLKVAKAEDIPLVLPAWLILPVAVHLMRMNSKFADYTSIDIQRFGNLMRLLHAMNTRFEGVQFVTKVIQNMIDALTSSTQNSISEEITQLQGMMGRVDLFERAQAIETVLLTTVADMIHSALAHEDSTLTSMRTRS